MANTLDRARGMDCDLVLSKAATGAVAMAHWKEFNCEEEIREMEDTAGGSAFEQFSIGPRKATGSFKGFTGDAEIMSSMRAGDEIKTIAVETIVEGESLITDLGDEAQFGKLIVTKVRFDLKIDPSEWGFDFRSGGH
jgi:hypothetical protein